MLNITPNSSVSSNKYRIELLEIGTPFVSASDKGKTPHETDVWIRLRMYRAYIPAICVGGPSKGSMDSFSIDTLVVPVTITGAWEYGSKEKVTRD